MTSSAVKKAFLLSKISGCFPFNLKDGKVITDYRCLVYSVVLKLVFAPQPIINIFQVSFLMTQSKIHMTTSMVVYILAFIFTYISFFNFFKNKKKLAKLLNNYSSIEAGFKSLGEKKYDSVKLHSDFLLLATGPSLITTRIIVTPNMTWYMLYQLVYLFNMMLSLYMLVQPFIRLVENMTLKMKRLGIILRELCVLTPSQKKTNQLGLVIYMYDLMCSTCEVLNEIFSYNILFIIFMTFILTTTYAYFTTVSVFDNYVVAFITGTVAIFYGLIMCRIAIHSERITKEAVEFNNVLFKVMIKDKFEDIQKNKKLRLHILMKRGVKLTACGMFSLDHALIHSMIAATTIYLVILEDFGKK